MRDQKLTTLLREYLESNPPRGLEKLIEAEMKSLCEHLAEFIFDVYQRGFDDGFDSCVETFREGAENLFGVKT
jgi:hypothetical protein